jgi:hypothetical protein
MVNSSLKQYVDDLVKIHIINHKDIIHKDRKLIDDLFAQLANILDILLPAFKQEILDLIAAFKSSIQADVQAFKETINSSITNLANKPFAYTTISHNVSFGTVSSKTLNVAGNIYCTNDIWAFYSDELLKDVVSELQDATQKIEKLRCVYYKNNALSNALLQEEDEKIRIGLIAQDVQEVLPEIVGPSPLDPKYLTLQYDKLSVLCLKAIQELNIRISKLENQLSL